jgi:ABC-type Fe3+/spermidine/putrescine transport system ATPase subunit
LTPWLACRRVAKRLGTKQVLRGLDLLVQRGEILSILGPSGSGKTTLIRLIAGLADPDAGEIDIAGRPVWGPGAAVRIEQRGVGVVFQDYAVWPHMTVAGNVGFGLRMAGLPAAERQARVQEALAAVHIADLSDRYPDQLSGGQQQRLALARSLAARPALILMDEPLSNVDSALREQLRLEILEAVRAQGATAIYITHDQSEAMALCDRLAVMHDGHILQSGAPEDLYRRPASRFVAGFLGGVNLLQGKVSAEDGVPMFTVGPWRLRLASWVEPRAHAAELMFRPEDAAPTEVVGCNRLGGVVRTSIFFGRCWRLTVAVQGRTLTLDWPCRVAEGTALEFAVLPDRCSILPAERDSSGRAPERQFC